MLNGPQSVVVDAAGNVFFADSNDQRIRKIAAGTGLISTVAGSGVASTYCNTANGDGGAATSATFASSPQSIALDGAGNLYIADTAGHRVRKVSAQTGIITTIAGAISGSGNSCAHDNGDGGLATAASVNAPDGVLVDGAGNVYIADNGNYVRKITASTGIINTIAGTGTGSFSGDGGPGTSATVNGPAQMAMDAAGDLYIADYHNQRVRMLTPAGMITTVAGNGTRSSTGNGGAATSATLDNPNSVALDPAGNLYITEEANHIRKVTAATGVISTVVGNGTAGATGDGGAATAGEINTPEGVGIDGAGNIYVADTNDNKIRVIQSNTGAEAFASTAGGVTSSDSPASILLGNIGNSAFNVSSFASSSNSFPLRVAHAPPEQPERVPPAR